MINCLRKYKCQNCEEYFSSYMTYDYNKHIVVCCAKCYFRFKNKKDKEDNKKNELQRLSKKDI